MEDVLKKLAQYNLIEKTQKNLEIQKEMLLQKKTSIMENKLK